MKVLRVLKPGLFTTIQDLGRHGHLRWGIPVSGAMDEFSLVAANSLVGNQANDACLEATLIGPELEALEEVQIAITGGTCPCLINGEEAPMWQTLSIRKGDIVSLGRMETGCRAYLAVRGGIAVPELLGSRSTYTRGRLGGLEGRQLKTDDMIDGFRASESVPKRRVPQHLIPRYTNHIKLHVILGPHADMFTKSGIHTFLSSQYTATSESDRMGYRMEGSPIEHKDKADTVSDALLPGSIQVPKSGKPIIIMRDAPTTGGYPKIAVAVHSDLSIVGQAKPNDTMEFSEITLKEAHFRLQGHAKLLADLENILVQSQQENKHPNANLKQ